MAQTTAHPSPLRILILGGSGFVSGTVARIAVEQGHNVTVLTRGERPVPACVKTLTADRKDRAAFARCLAEQNEPWDLVVDAIAFSPEDATQDVEAFSGRTGRLVFISTDFVYDPQRRNVPQSEHDAAYTTEGYGGQKRLAEIVLEQTPATQLPWTILRPSHIFGAGSLLGCLPLHGRDPRLIEHLRRGRPLKLVGGGTFLQHPIFVSDLAKTILALPSKPEAVGRVFNIAGPDIVESREYYRILGRLLANEVTIEPVSISEFLAEHPDKAPFCCDRVYNLSAMQTAGLNLPATPLAEGLRQQLESLSH